MPAAGSVGHLRTIRLLFFRRMDEPSIVAAAGAIRDDHGAVVAVVGCWSDAAKSGLIFDPAFPRSRGATFPH